MTIGYKIPILILLVLKMQLNILKTCNVLHRKLTGSKDWNMLEEVFDILPISSIGIFGYN